MLDSVDRDEACSMECTYAAEDVPLDTDSSSFWSVTRSVVADRDLYGRFIAECKTEIRSRWTQTSLYVLFVCPYHQLHLKPHADTAEETYGLWNWDVAELFIGSDFKNIQRYREFEVSPRGEWVDLDVDLGLPDHTTGWAWRSRCEVSARIEPKAKIWYAAIRIPFSDIDDQPPFPGRKFRLNLFRCQGPPESRYLVAWRSPMQDSFHVPERFGQLTLVQGDAPSSDLQQQASSVHDHRTLTI